MSNNEYLKYLFQQMEAGRDELDKMTEKALLAGDRLTRADIVNRSRELDILITEYYKISGL